MSWSVSAVGKPAAVAAKVQADLNAYKCVDPEEGVKQAAGAAIAAALGAQRADSAVKVEASGHQSGGGETASNTLRIVVEPIYGFVE
jgi:hypothetical protein